MEKKFVVGYEKYFDTKAAEIEFNIPTTHQCHRILFYRDKYNRPTVYLAHQNPKFSKRCVPYDYYDVVYGIWTMTENECNELYNYIVKSIDIKSFYDIHTRRRVYDFTPGLEVLYGVISDYIGG